MDGFYLVIWIQILARRDRERTPVFVAVSVDIDIRVFVNCNWVVTRWQ